MVGEQAETSPRDPATKRGVCLPVLVVDRDAELAMDRPLICSMRALRGRFRHLVPDIGTSSGLIDANASDEVVAAIAAAGAATPASGVRTATDG
jgi:hypothetical protein